MKNAQLLTPKQTAEMLGVSPKTLANYRCSGTGILIPYLKLSGRIKYKLSDIEAYINNSPTFEHTGQSKGVNNA